MSDTAYDRMTGMYTRQCDKTYAYAQMIGRFQGLADQAQLATRIGDSEWLQGIVKDMASHSEACDKEMQSWR